MKKNAEKFFGKMPKSLKASRLFAAVLVSTMVVSAAATAQQRASSKISSAAASKKSSQAAALTSKDILEAEQLLSDLGYWTGPIDKKFDASSRHALIAFQKVEGRAPTGKLTLAELKALQDADRPSPRDNSHPHVEIDLARQVLFVIDDQGTVSKVLPVSSGSGEQFTSEGWTRRAITPVGRFKVYNRIAGWRKSPLGRIYYPVYLVGGVAIHGYSSVPTHPASHGCIRIPMFAAKQFFEMTPIGTSVIVYDELMEEDELLPSPPSQ